MGEPCLEHVGNNFSPVPSKYIQEFIQMRNEILQLFNRACHAETMALIRGDAEKLQSQLSDYRRTIIHDIQGEQTSLMSNKFNNTIVGWASTPLMTLEVS